MPAVSVTQLETCCCYYSAADVNSRGDDDDPAEGRGEGHGSGNNDEGNDSDCYYSSEDGEDTECGDGIEAGSVACIYTQLVCVTFFFIWLMASSGV